MATEVTREKHRGTACVFVDPVGKAHDALITEVWGPQGVNVVYVTDEDGQIDNYGRVNVAQRAKVTAGCPRRCNAPASLVTTWSATRR